MKEIYGWVPWFKSLANTVAERDKDFLIERAKKVRWTPDGAKPPLLMHGDENIDPFSFIYYIAGRSDTVDNRQRIYSSINKPLRNSGTGMRCRRRSVLYPIIHP